jgi:signal transduction histidine kinase
MNLADWTTRGSSTARVVVSSAILALGLVIVVWMGYRTTSRELLTLLREQATSLRQTVAAAARSNLEASRQAQSEIEARMLATARMLVELDRRRVLDRNFLDELVRENSLFRVTVYGPNREPEYASQSSAGPRRGFGPGFAFGFGGDLLDRLLSDEEATELTDIHVSRWGEWRGFAAIKRARGGAIILNVDATAVENLKSQSSLDALLGDIVESAEQVAYVVFEQEGLQVAHGEMPVEYDSETFSGDAAAPSEREVEVQGRRVLELSGPIVMDESATAWLRLGMRLDGVQRAERRMLWQLALSLSASLALAVLGIGTVWLQRKYSLLSERHARAQEALRRRDRLAAMGELSSTVAHEIRNPLNAIAMSAKRLKREFVDTAAIPDEDRSEVEELIGVLEGETQRANQKIQQFLDYARPPRVAPRPTNLGELAGTVADGARALGQSRGVIVEAEVSAASDAAVDPEQIRQVLDNLVRNAIEATPEGGHVMVTVRNRGDVYEIEVADTGEGISPKDLPRVFDLYFTTKAEGTGVGLAVSQQIVTAHGGTIEVDSHPGEGTRMTVKIPARGEEGNP